MSHERSATRPRVWGVRAAGAALAALALIGLPGCGDCCDDHHDDFGGTLEIVDADPTFGVQTVQVSIPGNPVEPFDVFLAPGESAFIDLFPDTYDVDIIWEDALFDPCCTADIFDNQTTTVPVVHPGP